MPSSSGAEESDQQREAEAYNYNIYLMVATPYLLVGAVAFFVCRGLRRKARAAQAARRSLEAPSLPPTDLRPAAGD